MVCYDSATPPEPDDSLIHSPIAAEAAPTPQPAPTSPEPQWTRRNTPAYWRINIALFLAGFTTYSLIYCVQPLLPILADVFHVGAAESSLSLSLTTGFLAFSILCAGALAENFSRKGLMFVSMCGAAALNVLAALSPEWHVLLAARALEGIIIGGVPAVAMAYIAEEIDPRGLGLAMGLYISGNAFGGMAGRVISGFAAELVSWQFSLGFLGAAGLAAAIGFYLLLPPSRNFTPRRDFSLRSHLSIWRVHLANRRLVLLFLMGFLAMGTFVTAYNYIGFRLIAPPFSLTHGEVGLIFTAYLFGIFSSSAAGALSDKIGRGPVLTAGVLLSLVGVGLTTLPSIPGVVSGIAVLTIGFFATHSIASGWIGRAATSAKSHAAALYLLAYYLGSSLMGSSGGWFWTTGGWNAVAAFCGAMMVVGLVVAMRLNRRAPTVS